MSSAAAPVPENPDDASNLAKLTLPRNRVKTPTVLQLEAVECGAAALAIILGYYGRFVPLEELRIECGVSRDGSKASNITRAAKRYGLDARGFLKNLESLVQLPTPVILFWNFNHFLVFEGFQDGKAFINDPAAGPRQVSLQELDESFTGVVLTFELTPAFKKGGRPDQLYPALRRRLQGSERALTFAVLTGLFLVIPGLLIPTFSRVFVDNILLGQMKDWLKPLLIGMAATAIARAFLTWLQQHYLLRLQTKLGLSTSAQFFWHVLRLPIEFFMQRYPGELSSRVAINDKVAQLLSGQLATTVIGAITIVFYAIVMLAYDPVLTLIGISFAVLNIVALRYVSRKRVDESQKLLRARGHVVGVSMGGIQMMETLKSTGTESDFFVEWSGHYAKAMNAEQRLGAYNVYLNAVPALLDTLNTVALLAVGGLRVMDGHLSVGMLVAFQSLMASFTAPVAQLVGLGGQLQELQGDMKRLDDVLQYPRDPQVDAEGTAAAVGTESSEIVKLEGAVELKDVTFGYSRFDAPLIEGFSLKIAPGQRVALVGGSGSGKSTVAKLVSGLYRPWSGEILLDGRPREAYPRAVLNNSIGLVDQDITLFGGTITENLTMWDATLGDVDVVQAAKDACIHDDVAVRAEGYSSRMNESGSNFSGGQRQRLEIARALVANPTVMVLDEATSALDAATEKIIDDNLRRRGCTCLIVAHRLSTIRDADEIIVLEKGKVVQRGTHEELRQVPDGAYAKLIEG
jgi:NHLM bacteriocin system ABC transporter peptidase/ATP-binding protein